MGTKTKFIIGSDYSDRSSMAIEVGASWAQVLLSKAEVVHIEDGIVSDDYTKLLEEKSHGTFNEVRSLIKEKSEKKLKDQVRKALPDTPSISLEMKVIQGNKSNALIDYVKKENGKLLILGDKGESSLAEIFLGGTTERVLRTLNCPTLVVKNLAAKKPKRILWALDLENPRDITYEWAQLVSSNFDSEIILCHVLNPKVTQEETKDLFSRLERVKSSMERSGIKVTTIFEDCFENKISKSLETIIDREEVDLVILGQTHKKGPLQKLFTGSVGEYLVHNARVSFLVIKE